VAAAEAAFSLEIVHLDDEESAPALSREVSSKYKHYAKIGAATLVGGAIIGASGSLAAPAVIAAAAVENFDDEDLEVIEVEGEELTIGVKSGFIFRATEDSGDVKIGVAGQGKFKDVKIPSA
jgi:hypothetical protein